MQIKPLAYQSYANEWGIWQIPGIHVADYTALQFKRPLGSGDSSQEAASSCGDGLNS